MTQKNYKLAIVGFKGLNEAIPGNVNYLEKLASAYLLFAQVLVNSIEGSFDSDPERTFGCESNFLCGILSPVRRAPNPPGDDIVVGTRALNFDPLSGNPDVQQSFTMDVTETTLDFTPTNDQVWAEWSPSPAVMVPIPPALPLLASALLVCTGRKRQLPAGGI